MTRLVRASSSLYRCLVLCYPQEFRHRYGREMADTFEQHVEQAWEESGIAGVTLVWSVAAQELLRFALPGQVTRPAVAIPVLSLTLAGAILLPLTWALSNPLALFAWYHRVTSGMRH